MPSKLYWTTWSRDRMVKVRREMSPDLGSDGDDSEPSAGSLDGHITTTVDVGPWFDLKHRALLCHDTQFSADSWVRTLPAEALQRFIGFESLTLVHSAVSCDPSDPNLFAGLEHS